MVRAIRVLQTFCWHWSMSHYIMSLKRVSRPKNASWKLPVLMYLSIVVPTSDSIPLMLWPSVTCYSILHDDKNNPFPIPGHKYSGVSL